MAPHRDRRACSSPLVRDHVSIGPARRTGEGHGRSLIDASCTTARSVFVNSTKICSTTTVSVCQPIGRDTTPVPSLRTDTSWAACLHAFRCSGGADFLQLADAQMPVVTSATSVALQAWVAHWWPKPRWGLSWAASSSKGSKRRGSRSRTAQKAVGVGVTNEK